MRISEDITARSGTMNLASTTWAGKKVAEITKRDTKSSDNLDVDHFHSVHVTFHIRLYNFVITGFFYILITLSLTCLM